MSNPTTSLLPLKLWGIAGPNPSKVFLIISELDLPYELVPIAMNAVKDPSYVAINPNGRLPSLQDPNNGDLIIWESGAIIDYLIDRYDTSHKLSFEPGSHEAYRARSWLHFQMSGQGPMYGQMFWFKNFHSEKLPSVVERYVKEVKRVSGVLDAWLGQQKERFGSEGEGPYLVGKKISYADLAFVTWQWISLRVLGEDEGFTEDEYPHLKEWFHRVTGRERVKAALEEVPPMKR